MSDFYWMGEGRLMGIDLSRGTDHTVVCWSQPCDPMKWDVFDFDSCEWPPRRHRFVSRGPGHLEVVNWRKAKRLMRKDIAELVKLEF